MFPAHLVEFNGNVVCCLFPSTVFLYGLKVLQLLTSGMTESISHLAADDAAGLKAMVLHSLSLRLASCRSDIHNFLKHTLLWVQAERLGVNVIGLADQCIQVHLLNQCWLQNANLTSVAYLMLMMFCFLMRLSVISG